jgi:hypothetical protein
MNDYFALQLDAERYQRELATLRERVAELEGVIADALATANDRWDEWGERAELVRNVLERATPSGRTAPPACPACEGRGVLGEGLTVVFCDGCGASGRAPPSGGTSP